MKLFRILFLLIILVVVSCAHLKEVKQAYHGQHYTQALALCQTATQQNPKDGEAWLWMAKAHHALDSTVQCVNALATLFSLESVSPKIRTETAGIYFDIGRKAPRSDALRFFTLAEQADSNHVATLDTLAQIYEREGAYDAAILRYDRIIMLVNDASVYMTRVNALENRLTFAKSEYQKGMRALRDGRKSEAETHFNKAATADPNHAEAVFHYGFLKGNRLYKEGRDADLEEAIAVLGQAAKAKPSHAETHYLLGKVSEKAGRKYLSTAIRAYEDCLKAAPNGTHAATCRKKIKSLKKQKAFWEKG